MPKMDKRLVWVVPEERGGIRDYADELWPHVETMCGAAGWSALRLDSAPLRSGKDARKLIDAVKDLRPALLHVQHEFGLFGSKIPFRYRFPAFAAQLALIAPTVATAHNVLYPEYELPWRGKGWQSAGRFIFNLFLLPVFKRQWLHGTWGRLSGVIVHSRLQERAITSAGCARVTTIPHFVPSRAKAVDNGSNTVVVFGFFSPEKGQDLIIRAWSHVRTEGARLILAGGVRRPQDKPYYDACVNLIRSLRLEAKVEISGYVPAEKVDAVYASATLVVAPFRETTGSGSLAQAFARGMPVLTSDLPLNTELLERVPSCLEVFKAGDPLDCAGKIDALLINKVRRQELAEAACEYASRFAPAEIVRRHFDFYETLIT